MLAILCVIGLALGQIFFKYSAKNLKLDEPYYGVSSLIYLFIAFALYGIVSILWVFILRKIELGKIYPIMALAFVFVPLGSYIAFSEIFNSRYWVGVCIIIVGIIVSIYH